MPSTPRILIITAAFGEGHNSAARNLSAALGIRNATSLVADPCLLASPHATAVLQWGYRMATTHFHRIWEKIYHATDKYDFSRPNLPFMRGPERHLSTLISEYKPTAIAATYPVYPYFIERHFKETGTRIPVFTLVTDSIEINASWLRAPTDFFLVTDQTTLETMRCRGIPEEKIISTGFAVNPAFSQLSPLPADDPCQPFRVLYFPTAKKPFLRRHSRALLDADPRVRLTIVMGKNVRLLHSRARQIRAAHPGRVRLLGWTRKIPALLTSHHLVVGKAGGATVHEAIAATTPMLIHHLVPGQEEGNLRLLQQLGAGDLAETPAELTRALSQILANNQSRWRKMKTSLAAHNRNDGALAAADFILSHS